MKTKYLTVAGLISTGIAVWLWSKLCIYITIAVKPFYRESLYAVAPNHVTGNYHAYLMVNGVPKDPQLLCLGLSPNVDYLNPALLTNSTTELLDRTYTW